MTSSADFAFVGDVHLERLRTVLPGDSVGLQLQALRGILRRVSKLGLRTVVFGGDLFDTANPEDETKLRLADLFLEFPKLRIIVYPGNHDRPLIARHSLRLFDWIGQRRTLNLEVILEPTVRRFGAHRVWICPHPYIQEQPAEACLALGHFPWSGARRDTGSVEPHGSSPAGRWLLGDFHTPQEGERYTYAGSTTQITWQEGPVKSWLHVRLADTPVIRRVAIKPTYTLTTLEVRTASDLETIDPTATTAFYRLVVYPEAQLPSDWQRRYPTVIRRDPLKVASDAKRQLARVQLSEDPFEGLEDYLRDRGKLTAKQIAWSVRYTGKLALSV